MDIAIRLSGLVRAANGPDVLRGPRRATALVPGVVGLGCFLADWDWGVPAPSAEDCLVCRGGTTPALLPDVLGRGAPTLILSSDGGDFTFDDLGRVELILVIQTAKL